jgi:hypothetical protein
MNQVRGLAAMVIGMAMCGAMARASGRVDQSGQLERLDCGKGWVPLRTEVRVVRKNWAKSISMAEARDVQRSTEGDRSTWKAKLTDGNDLAVQIEQTVHEENGQLVFEFAATALQPAQLEGVLFEVLFPAEVFAKGLLRVADKSIDLPATLPADIHYWNAATPSLSVLDPRRKIEVKVDAPPATKIHVQDGRKWTNIFQTMVYIHSGDMTEGQTARLRVALSATGEVDQTPARIAVDPSQVRYKLAGIGGNYCFSIESPVTRFTLDNLKVAAARTEMSIRAWAPKKMYEDPAGTDYSLFAAADQPGSRLRQELEMMRQFTRNRIPFTTSIWRMPAWLADTVATSSDGRRVHITEQQWPFVLQAIGSYLLYAKEKYQAEPDYFSFNEPDLGVDVLQTPEEHRDGIKRLGAHFAKLGLKTKLLLGDVASPRRTHGYVQPAADDPEAMKYVGALSFHSWGGASDEQYAQWGQLAEKLKLPLIVAEAGVDAGAWRSRSYRSFGYAIREIEHYQKLLMHARPQSILYWEYTGDYSLAATEAAPGSQPGWTERLCIQKHWCDLTPPGAEALQVQSDNDAILTTVFRTASPSPGYTIHLGNPWWERPVTIQGLPSTLKSLQVVRTARGELFKELAATPVVNGTVTLTLSAESLTTLTTLPVPGLKAQ